MVLGTDRGATVGRVAEGDRVGLRLSELDAGRGGVILLSGEPGIGKTRLALDAAARARRQGQVVGWGHCPEAGGAPAFWPWVQILRDVVAVEGAPAVRERLGPAAADVLGLIGAGDLLPVHPTAALVASQRFRLFDGVAHLLAGIGRPVLVVIEDVHRADEPSVALLRHLLGEAGRAPVLVLVTYRDTDAGADGGLRSALAAAASAPWCEDVRLGPLLPGEAAEMVRSLPGTALLPEDLTELVARGGGNPFFLQQLAGAPWSPAGTAPIPATVREVITERVNGLPPDCASLLGVVAVIGRQALVAVVGEAAELPLTQIHELLRPAAVGGLLFVADDGRKVGFAHALVQETLYSALDSSRRAELHERLAVITGRRATEDPRFSAAAAEHALQAVRGGRHVDCVPALRVAARAAAGRLAFEETGRLLELALEECDRPDVRVALLLELGEAEVSAGRGAAGREHFERATQAADVAGDPEALAAAALGIGSCVVPVGEVDWGVVTRLQRALHQLPDDDRPWRPRLLARLAIELYWHAGGDESRDVSAAALPYADTADDVRTRAEVLHARQFTLRGPAHRDERLTIGRRLVDLAVHHGLDDIELRGRVYWLRELLQAGDLPAYRANVQRLDRIAGRTGQPLHRWYAELLAAERALLIGHVPDAIAHSDRAAAAARRLGIEAGEIYFLGQQAALRRDLGGLEELVEPLAAIADRYPTLVTMRIILAIVQAELDNLPEAADQLQRIAADGFARLPADSLWIATLCYAVEIAHFVHDQDIAATALQLLQPHAGTCAVQGLPVCWGAVNRALGLGHLTCGNAERGMTELRAALELHQRWGMRPLVARTNLDLADAALVTGTGDRSTVRTHVENARDTAETLGLHRLAARATALRAAAEPPTTTSHVTGPGGSLSPREHDVLALIVTGATNNAIAAALVISLNTVERHTRNIYLKLGVTNRTEAVAVAMRHKG